MSKDTYIALLRGINVSGNRIIKMDELRGPFETLGFADVKTYVQSGNVIFKARQKASARISKEIEEKIVKEFGFPVIVLVRSSGEIDETIKNNPFLKEKGIDFSKLHVTFLSRPPEEAAIRRLDALNASPDRFCTCGEAIYLHCPNGYARTKLSNNALERLLSVSATTRNWKTVNKLHELALEQ